MSRNLELEALLQAKFDLDYCDTGQRDVYLARFHNMLDQAITRSGVPGLTRLQLEESLLEAYKEFRRTKLLEERARLSRLR